MKFDKNIYTVGLIALLLNIVWEYSHHSLYTSTTGMPEYLNLTIAALIDMLLIFGIIGLISLVNRSWQWLNDPKKFDYLLIILVGLLAGVIVELVGFGLGLWHYTGNMPLILGFGLTPLFQLSITGSLAVFINSKLN